MMPPLLRTMLLGVTALAAVLMVSWSTEAARAAEPAMADDPLDWPPATAASRPWTRWWWLGSAVDEPNLTRLLTEYRDAGLGGVEILPIYGAKGYEDRFVEFLSPRWMALLAHTTREAEQLGLGVDLTAGTGWPFGGPHVAPEDASAGLVLKRYELANGESLREGLPTGELVALFATSEKDERIDLTDRIKDGHLDWVPPSGQWRLYAALTRSPVQKVKRAAPGGAGYVLDPYSVEALDRYLAVFDQAFEGYSAAMPRAFFHDSFEYFRADWTDDFLDEFETRRGYDLRSELPALFGDGREDRVARVKSDYRETIAELHLAYIRRWTEWCHKHGSLSRNQAHGAPGNLLDLYAAADIPETEIFGPVDERQIPMQKFASSAAHLSGRRLVSAEAFTWLDEHFQTSLSEAKQAADDLFLTGVNHLFFHGIPYSPANAPWPGWQFYASVNFGPQGGLWRDLPAFNAYLTRCQSILQAGRPDNDVLLYVPQHDLWHTPADKLIHFKVHNVEERLAPHPFYAAAMTMWDRGYAFDLVSDALLADARSEEGHVVLGDDAYAAVFVPRCRLMPAATLERLFSLGRDGATVIFEGGPPEDVPGWGDLKSRRAAFREARAAIGPAEGDAQVRRSSLGTGQVLIGRDPDLLLREAGVPREPCTDRGLRFVRRSRPGGHDYFLANRGEKTVGGWVTLGRPAASAVLLDPRFADRAGVAALRQQEDGSAQVYLQLLPGESCVLRTFPEPIDGPAWKYLLTAGEPRPLTGAWDVEFIAGGPELPPQGEIDELRSWTDFGGEAERFAGTARYRLEFDRPAGDAADWLLDLGRVAETARVRLNGHDLGTLWSTPYRIAVGDELRSGRNVLEVEVTNLAANRIRDLDRRGAAWKSFYDANVVGRDYKPLDASEWPLRESGLLGPVTLTPAASASGGLPADES